MPWKDLVLRCVHLYVRTEYVKFMSAVSEQMGTNGSKDLEMTFGLRIERIVLIQ